MRSYRAYHLKKYQIISHLQRVAAATAFEPAKHSIGSLEFLVYCAFSNVTYCKYFRFVAGAFLMKHLLAALLLSIAIAPSVSAQKLVDPSKVAPEFREAAEKRRVEQLRQQQCVRKAEAEKVIARDRTAFVLQCIEADAGK